MYILLYVRTDECELNMRCVYVARCGWVRVCVSMCMFGE